jgi:hypothetical protein
MKTWILFLVTFLSALNLKAQNWSVFNPSYRYNYSLESEGYTTAVVFADSNVTSGSNAVYSLNRIVVKCDLSQPSMQVQGCTNPNYWLGNQPQFLQRRIIYSGQDYRLSDTGTYIIKHREAIGSPWTFNATYSITAQVQSEIQKNVFGVLDSVRIIILSTSDTILLSKQFGIIKYPAEFGQHHYYKLRGIENKASYDVTALYGEKVPNYYDFFKLKPGVKHYYSTQQVHNSACSASLYGMNTVLSSSLNGTLITNTVREQFMGCKTFTVCNATPNPGCWNNFSWPSPYPSPYNSINSMQTSTIQINYNPNSYPPISNTGYNNQLQSMNSLGICMVITFGMSDNMHFYKTYGASCMSKHIRSNPLNEGIYEGIRLTTTSTPNIYLSVSPQSYNAAGETYIEGYGLVNQYGIIFEGFYVYCTSLIVDGNDSLGGTNALTMGLNDAVKQDEMNRVYPNPAKYELHINVPYEAQNKGSIILRDVLGKTLETIVINGEESYQLTIEPYATGVYFLSIQSPRYSRTYKVIKD